MLRIKLNQRIQALSVCLFVGFFSAAYAETDALIEGAKLCTKPLSKLEKEYGIPDHLLTAIATTESGVYHSGLKIDVPWPWMLSVHGEKTAYSTLNDAIVANEKLDRSGEMSAKVGCMQVSWRDYPKSFPTIEAAFDAEKNTLYAAMLLKNSHDKSGSWKHAVIDYHNKSLEENESFLRIVYINWYRIVDSLRETELKHPSKTLIAEMKGMRPANGYDPVKPLNQQTKKISTCRFKTPDAIMCDNARIAARVFSTYGFNSKLINQSYTLDILERAGCYKTTSYGKEYQREWHPTAIKVLRKGRIAEPNGWTDAMALDITFNRIPQHPDRQNASITMNIASAYMDGTCDVEPPQPQKIELQKTQASDFIFND